MSTCPELFRFEPGDYHVPPDTVHSVRVVGDFNDWGESAHRGELFQDAAHRWTGLVEVPRGGTVYKFLVNENHLYPDVGPLSVAPVITPSWTHRTTWYQIMVDRFSRDDRPVGPGVSDWRRRPDHFNTFGGSLRGLLSRLPYLKSLFGTLRDKAIYLNPVHKSQASNHKYWPEDFEAIDPSLGTDEDLQALADALHVEGGRLMLDLVYNHTGLNHPAFLDVLQHGPASQYRHWYRLLPDDKILLPVVDRGAANISVLNDPRGEDYDAQQASFLSVWGGKYRFPMTATHGATLHELIEAQPYYRLTEVHMACNYGCWIGLFELPELDTQNPEVRRHLIDAAIKWLRLGVDGFRLDVPDVLRTAHGFWAQFRREVEAAAAAMGRNPADVYIIGELWTHTQWVPTYLTPAVDGRPLRFDALMNYPVRQAVLDFLSNDMLMPGTDTVSQPGGLSASELDRRLHHNLGDMSWGIDKAHYNIFSSHDTRRLRTVLGNDYRLLTALVMAFTLVGAPTLYYGDEIGMLGGPDPECRAPMRWDIADHPQGTEATIFMLVQALSRLRDARSCLIDGILHTVAVDDGHGLYAYARWTSAHDCVLVIILREAPTGAISIDVSKTLVSGVPSWHLALTPSGGTVTVANGVLSLPAAWWTIGGAVVLVPATET